MFAPAAFAPDSRSVFVGNVPEPGVVGRYDLLTDELTPTIVDRGAVSFVAVSPQGDLVAVADAEGTVRLFDAETFEPTGEELPGNGFGLLAFSPSGSKIAVGANRLRRTSRRI